MNFQEAFAAALAGKRITRPVWRHGLKPVQYVEIYPARPTKCHRLYARDDFKMTFAFSAADIVATDWQIYDENTPHDFLEAIQWIMDHKSVRRRIWDKHNYLYLGGNGKVVDPLGYYYQWDISDFRATDWELVTKVEAGKK